MKENEDLRSQDVPEVFSQRPGLSSALIHIRTCVLCNVRPPLQPPGSEDIRAAGEH